MIVRLVPTVLIRDSGVQPIGKLVEQTGAHKNEVIGARFVPAEKPVVDDMISPG